MATHSSGQGDDGKTGILGEGRFSKAELRFEVLGTLDEACAGLGLARAQCQSKEMLDVIWQAQRDLQGIMAEVAAQSKMAAKFRSISRQQVNWLEEQIRRFGDQIPQPKGFIVAGDNLGAAALDLARTIVRRAERRMVALSEQGEIEASELIIYLNRLSTLVFVLEVYEMHRFVKHDPTA